MEEGISIPGDNGKIIPLPRVGRNPPWITRDIIPDDGFVIIYFKQNRESLDHPRTHPKTLRTFRICMV